MFYVLDENKNLVEAYSKEDVLALLEQAIEDGDLSSIEHDSAFVTKIKSAVNGTTHHIEFVTMEKYNELQQAGTLVANTYYFITDDASYEDLMEHISGIETDLTTLDNRVTTLEGVKLYRHLLKVTGDVVSWSQSNGVGSSLGTYEVYIEYINRSRTKLDATAVKVLLMYPQIYTEATKFSCTGKVNNGSYLIPHLFYFDSLGDGIGYIKCLAMLNGSLTTINQFFDLDNSMAVEDNVYEI